MIGNWFLGYMMRCMAPFTSLLAFVGALQRVGELMQGMVMSLYVQGSRTAQQTTEPGCFTVLCCCMQRRLSTT